MFSNLSFSPESRKRENVIDLNALQEIQIYITITIRVFSTRKIIFDLCYRFPFTNLDRFFFNISPLHLFSVRQTLRR